MCNIYINIDPSEVPLDVFVGKLFLKVFIVLIVWNGDNFDFIVYLLMFLDVSTVDQVTGSGVQRHSEWT